MMRIARHEIANAPQAGLGERPSGVRKRHPFLAVASSGVFSYLCVSIFFLFAAIAATSWLFARDLPGYSELQQYEPPVISRLLSRDGRVIDEFANQRRLFTAIDDIPPLVVNAFISAEDKSYFDHRGYDLVGIMKAVLQAFRQGQLRGASTITQQVVKNFLLSGDRSIERKMKEVILAVKLERLLDKHQILELYLNEIFLGQNSYGVTAAAQTYFNKPLEDLEIEEAAYLAAIPKAPSTYHPVRNQQRAKTRRNFVIREMVDNGYLSPAEGEAAMARELRSVFGGHYESYRAAIPPRSYFTDEIRRQLSKEFGSEEFFEGGLIVSTTIDPILQSVATQALRTSLVAYDRSLGDWRGTGIRIPLDKLESRSEWQKALAEVSIARDIENWIPAIVLDLDGERAWIGLIEDGATRVGEILNSNLDWIKRLRGKTLGRKAAAGDLLSVGEVVHVSRVAVEGDAPSWELQQIPEVEGAFVAMDVNTARVLAMQGGVSYQHSVFNRATQANRQPGSAFKPIVYATALDSGYTPASILIDAPIEIETHDGVWQPQNFSKKFYGPVPLRTGLEYSRNLMTIRLANDVGIDLVAEYAERVGLYDSMDQVIANVLGAQETTLLKLAVAYAMFANGGQLVEPTLVDRVQDRRGKTIYRHDKRLCMSCSNLNLPPGIVPYILSDRPQIIDEITAYQITSMLQGVVENGTASSVVDADFAVAGKTGTTNESKDAWFVGYTSEIVAGCYVGYDLPKPLGRRATGSRLCGPVFNTFIKEASRYYGAAKFRIPEGGDFVAIDRLTGEPVKVPDNEDFDGIVREFFRAGTEPEPGKLRIISGGFPMSSDIPIHDPREESTASASRVGQDPEGAQDAGDDQETGSFGSLTAGGLY